MERTEVVEGIKLTPSETKVIDCICKILHENSQNIDPKRLDYYTGNAGLELTKYQKDEETPMPKIAVTLYELTKEYKGGEAVSGKDLENVKATLLGLDEKRFLIRYTEKTRAKNGEYKKAEVEQLRKILDLDRATLSYGIGEVEKFKQSEIIITLHPIFRRQINSKFITYPNDINQRTKIAYGSHNIPEATLRLRDYLMREQSAKRYKSEIGQERLYYFLAEKWMKESRRKKVKEFTDRAIKTVTAMGLVESHMIDVAKDGTPKVIFQLSKGWK